MCEPALAIVISSNNDMTRTCGRQVIYNSILVSRERLSFVLRRIPNGDTHHLEVGAKQKVLHADESASGQGDGGKAEEV